VDHFIAISHYIARRIAKSYRRDACVIYPPVDMAGFELGGDKTGDYFTASRLVPYKKVLLIIQAFNCMPDKRLIVMGDGPELAKAKALAGPNVTIIGHQPRAALMAHLQSARAFVFAAEEDFGIAPLEAQACGTPVIAFGKGGAKETIRGLDANSPTGVFFQEQTEQAIMDAVALFEAESERITPMACRQNALRFSQERFRQEFSACVRERMDQFRQQQALGT
jgi:glycosyltransferase involved in cell wall biosynthesis